MGNATAVGSNTENLPAGSRLIAYMQPAQVSRKSSHSSTDAQPTMATSPSSPARFTSVMSPFATDFQPSSSKPQDQNPYFSVVKTAAAPSLEQKFSQVVSMHDHEFQPRFQQVNLVFFYKREHCLTLFVSLRLRLMRSMRLLCIWAIALVRRPSSRSMAVIKPVCFISIRQTVSSEEYLLQVMLSADLTSSNFSDFHTGNLSTPPNSGVPISSTTTMSGLRRKVVKSPVAPYGMGNASNIAVVSVHTSLSVIMKFSFSCVSGVNWWHYILL